VGPKVNGTGLGSVNGQIPFDGHLQIQRTALTLANGSIYAGFATHGVNEPYHGWILGFSATTLEPTAVFCDTPNGQDGGIWMSGAGMAVDSNGAMFVATGNGDFDQAKSNYSDSLLKLVVDTTTSSTNQNSNGWG